MHIRRVQIIGVTFKGFSSPSGGSPRKTHRINSTHRVSSSLNTFNRVSFIPSTPDGEVLGCIAHPLFNKVVIDYFSQ